MSAYFGEQEEKSLYSLMMFFIRRIFGKRVGRTVSGSVLLVIGFLLTHMVGNWCTLLSNSDKCPDPATSSLTYTCCNGWTKNQIVASLDVLVKLAELFRALRFSPTVMKGICLDTLGGV
jgi:hypothetical protein